jgi:hypothetical protein
MHGSCTALGQAAAAHPPHLSLPSLRCRCRRLQLRADPGSAAPAAADARPVLPATLLLERVPLPAPASAGAATPGAGAGGGAKPGSALVDASAAAAACQVMVAVRLPGQDQGLRLGVLDEVFPPPPLGAAEPYACPAPGCAVPLGQLQLPIDGLWEGAPGGAPPQAQQAGGAAVDDFGHRGGPKPASGSFGLLEGILAARAREPGGADGGSSGRAPEAGAAGVSGEGGGVLCVSVSFTLLDLVPPRPRPLLAAGAPAAAAAELDPGGAAPPSGTVAAPAFWLPPAASGASPPPRRLHVHRLSSCPRLLLIDGFWGASACAAVAAAAGPRLTRSRVATGTETPSRTSWSTFFTREAAETPLIRGAEAAIEALFAEPAVIGGLRPLAKTEALQGALWRRGAGPGARGGLRTE